MITRFTASATFNFWQNNLGARSSRTLPCVRGCAWVTSSLKILNRRSTRLAVHPDMVRIPGGRARGWAITDMKRDWGVIFPTTFTTSGGR
jgi:hypothetical protein